MASENITLIDDLRLALDRDSAALDAEGITYWLMRFAGGHPIDLVHPRTGQKIHLGGVAFSGSTVLVFDEFVAHSVESLVERHTKAVEIGLKDVPASQLKRTAEVAAERIGVARAMLLHRAGDVKSRLAGMGSGRPAPVIGPRAIPEPVRVRERLQQRAADLLAAHRMASPQPWFDWLERQARANPAAWAIVGGLIVIATSFAAALIGRQ